MKITFRRTIFAQKFNVKDWNSCSNYNKNTKIATTKISRRGKLNLQEKINFLLKARWKHRQDIFAEDQLDTNGKCESRSGGKGWSEHSEKCWYVVDFLECFMIHGTPDMLKNIIKLKLISEISRYDVFNTLFREKCMSCAGKNLVSKEWSRLCICGSLYTDTTESG